MLLISLLLSWITALTLIPFLADRMYKRGIKLAADGDDVYGHPVFKGYRRVLSWCLQHRLLTMLAMLALLVTSAVGFKQVKQAFFPPSTTPMFYV